jgi:hypothetical protein
LENLKLERRVRTSILDEEQANSFLDFLRLLLFIVTCPLFVDGMRLCVVRRVREVFEI